MVQPAQQTREWQEEDEDGTHEHNYFNMPFDGIQKLLRAISDLEVPARLPSCVYQLVLMLFASSCLNPEL